MKRSYTFTQEDWNSIGSSGKNFIYFLLTYLEKYIEEETIMSLRRRKGEERQRTVKNIKLL